jgi:hypothetical protein
MLLKTLLQTYTYRTREREDLKHMDKASLHFLQAATASSSGGGASAASGGKCAAKRAAAAGSGAQRRKRAIGERLAAGKGKVGARTLARKKAKEDKADVKRARRRERKEVRLLAEGLAAGAAQ